MAHHKYDKFEEQAADLVKWNRDHNRLMADRRRELEADGWTVTTEGANSFKLEGASAVVAGKPDLVATKPGQVLVVDGKTGRQRESDIAQVLIYLFALPKARPDLTVGADVVGEVQYRQEVVTLSAAEVDERFIGDLKSMVAVIASDTPPPKSPSREECRFCNIGPKDCPQRVTKDVGAVAVGEF